MSAERHPVLRVDPVGDALIGRIVWQPEACLQREPKDGKRARIVWLLKVANLSEVFVPLNPTFRLWVPVT